MAACARHRGPATVAARQARAPLERRVVRGESMTGIFESGDEVALEPAYYQDHAPAHGDVVVYNPRRPIIKVVRGVAGDRFAVVQRGEQWNLAINGELAVTTRGEPYSLDAQAQRMIGLYERDYHGVIPSDACLILGNTPTGSLDSTRLGLVARSDLVGRVIAKVIP